MELWPDLRASLVLAVMGLMFLSATPLCDTTRGQNFATAEQRDRYRAEAGWMAAPVLAAAWVNNHGRQRVVDALHPLERALWIDQYWNLYPVKSPTWRTFEVRLDGEVVFRRGDPALAWQAHLLDNWEVRTTLGVGRQQPRNLAGVVDLIVRRARAERPDLQRVEVGWLEGRYPGEDVHEVATVTAAAPDFAPDLP